MHAIVAQANGQAAAWRAGCASPAVPPTCFRSALRVVSPHDGAKASGQGAGARHRRRRSEANAAAASVLARRSAPSATSRARRDVQHARRGGPSEPRLPHLAVCGEATVGRAGPAPPALHYTASRHTYCVTVALGQGRLSSSRQHHLSHLCHGRRSRTTAPRWCASCAPRAACTSGAATSPAATTRASPTSYSAAAVRSAVR